MTGYYHDDLALVHHLGFGAFADACAPGILRLLEPVLERRGLVLELGCGSGALTRHLVQAGHRVIATDASTAMLDLARQQVSGAEEIRSLVLPDDPLPDADAIVSVGHVLSYLPDAAAIDRALEAAAGALQPGGVLALDLLDFKYGEVRAEAPPQGRRTDDWCIITEFERPAEDLFVRNITTFVRNPDDSWRRHDERHVNVLIDTSDVPDRLAADRLTATVDPAFGTEEMAEGQVAIVGYRPA